jgi:pimeloyl-ACP methyl ester carboxylesterase
MRAAELIERWRAAGRVVSVADDEVFVVDQAPAAPAEGPPVLIVHGFPTSSIDWAPVIPALAATRRVVLLDLPGFGLSSKEDRAYSLFDQADVIEAVAASLDLDEVDLVTHDMGDSVGGELLARSLEDVLSFAVRHRVVSNGSIYVDLARLTEGQQMLESLPDEALPEGLTPDASAMAVTLAATMASAGPEDQSHLEAAAELVVADAGATLLPRIFRYFEERRRNESRWTGAIESHPAPVTVVWGDQDPIAVIEMAERLVDRRRDAQYLRLDGVGHYPMLEAPARFATAVASGL